MTVNEPGPILVITRNLPPVTGGMERLIAEALRALTSEARVSVVGPADAEALLPTGATYVGEFPLAPNAASLLAGLIASVRAARRLRPQLVLGGSGVCAPMVLAASRAADCASAIFVHGLDLVYPSPLYQHCFLPALRRVGLVIANSRHTCALATAAGVRADRTTLIHPGVELPTAIPAAAIDTFRDRHGLARCRWLLSVGRLTPRKGLAPFIRLVLPELVRNHPDLRLLIVGQRPDAALDPRHRAGGEDLETAAIAAGVGKQVLLVGRLDDAELALAYAGAAAMVFPVLDLPSDVEGFGMVALEAAAHGVPTFGFAVGGVVDAIADGLSGRLLASSDYKGLTAALDSQLSGFAFDPVACRRFAATKCWNEFGAQLRAACMKISPP